VNARTAAAARMTEAELQDRVRAMCDALGLVVRHVRDERGNWLQGWPDLDILGTRLIHRELKSMRGQLTGDQRRVGAKLTRAGQDWAVWRPVDLLDGTIARKLTAISNSPIGRHIT
jgi:hypothetical protein